MRSNKRKINLTSKIRSSFIFRFFLDSRPRFLEDKLSRNDIPFTLSLFPLIFIFLSLIFLFSCSEEPTFDNLFDPDNPLTPMQGELQITQLSDSQVRLQWQKNNDVKGNYRIERKVGNENYITRATVGADTTTYIDTALTINTLYKYRIFGVNDQNETEPITNDSVYTYFVSITNFNIQQQNIFTAKLTWTHNCNYEEGYIIERKEVAQASKPVTNVTLRLTSESSLAKRYIQIKQQKAKSKKQNLITDPIIESKESQKGKDEFVVIDTLQANTFSYIDDNLGPNHSYEYRIKAFTKYNESSYKTDVFFNIIPAPTEFSVEQENVHTFYLTWYDNSIGEQGFKIERKIDNSSYEEIANLAPDTENYTDDINSKNTFDNVYYKLYAYYNEETSAIVYINSVIEFEPIYNLEYEKLTINKIRLTWEDTNEGEDGFIIEKRVNQGNWVYQDTITENEWTDENAEINQNIQYRVQVFSGDNYTDFVLTDEIDNTFPEPTNLIITQDNVHTFSLVWNDNSNGEQGFKIERKIDAGDYILIQTNAENDTTYIDDINTREQFETVYYKIYAFYEDIYSYSLIGSCLIIFTAPTNLQHQQLTISSIQLTWEDNSNGEDGFKIDKKVGTNTWQEEYGIATENDTIWIDLNADINEILKYRVYAFSGNNNSTLIETDEIDNTFPAPTNLNCIAINVEQIELEWTDNSIGEDGFIIEQKENGGNFIEIGNTSQNNYIASNLSFDSDYIFKVKAFSGNNFSDYSNEFSINIKQSISPANLQGNVSFDEIEIHWTDNCSFEDGFIIEQKENEGSFIEIGTTSQNNYIASNLSFDSDYIFRVKAFSGNNFSDYSNEFSINIKQAISPANLQGNVSLTEIEIYWSDNCTFETGFIIQRKKEGEEYQTIHINSVNDTTYIDYTVEILKKYYYRVATKYENYQSEWSNEIELFTGPENAIIVDCNGGGDYLTIQEGIDAAVNGDLVIIKEGTYYENIDFNGKDITVASLFFVTQNTSYISQTIIDGNQNGSVVTFNSGENSTSILTGFTITNGSASYYGGGGICCRINSSPSLENVTITGNAAYYDGGGIFCCDNYYNPSLTNVTITGNSAASSGGGIYCSSSSPSLTNVTISDNYASSGGGIYCDWDSSPNLMNCILWNDSPQEIYFYQYYEPNSITISYSDVQGGESGIVTNNSGTVYWQTGNINANPLFIGSGNFHLQSGSPCINTGNPAPQYNDPNGTRNDMGAYGGPGGDW